MKTYTFLKKLKVKYKNSRSGSYIKTNGITLTLANTNRIVYKMFIFNYCKQNYSKCLTRKESTKLKKVTHT